MTAQIVEPHPLRQPRSAAPRETVDRAEMERGARLLMPPGGVIEVRALGVPRVRTASGYFDDPQALVAAAAKWSGEAHGVYVTFNEVDRALLARAHNRMAVAPEHTTSDASIKSRRWMLIDVDAVRPSGISSTDAEHEAALARADAVAEYLDGHGWPAPVMLDSGNGAALLYRITLGVNDTSALLVERCLAAVALLFDDEVVVIDQSVKNPSRLVRLPGSLNAKGDDTPDRPHRLARIRSLPERIEAVSQFQLSQLAGFAPQPPTRASASGTFDVAGWLTAHGVEVLRSGPWNGGERWVLTVCPWNPEHRDGAAFVLRFANGALAAGCHHASCAGKKWADLRGLFGDTKETKSTNLAVGSASGSGGTSSPSSLSFRERPWPELHPDALYGVAGRAVALIAPHTEADSAALLLRILIGAGSLAGRGPHARVESDRHGMNEFGLVVGETGKARKDTGRGRADAIFAGLDLGWSASCQVSGLSTGEGLIHAVRDEITKTEMVKEKGRPTGEYVTVVVDPGVEDKRLLVNESEFARTLKVINRESNILSAVLRDAWDGRDLRVMTRTTPLHATEPHVSVLSNITRDELRRLLTETDICNGFLNRFLIVCARRSKLLPEGGGEIDLADIRRHMGRMLAWVSEQPRLFARDTEAREMWAKVYPELSQGAGGLFGAATNRAEAHVLRLSCIYAMLDTTETVRPEHLRAALALWRYCADSASYIFGDAIGDPVADRIVDALHTAPDGLTRTELHALFGRNISVGRLDAALSLLLRLGRAQRFAEATEGGRAAERWLLAPRSGMEPTGGEQPAGPATKGSERGQDAASDDGSGEGREVFTL